MAFESLSSEALSKKTDVDRWGFLPRARCRCGAELFYRAPNLTVVDNVVVAGAGGKPFAVKTGLVCGCGAVFTRGLNTR